MALRGQRMHGEGHHAAGSVRQEYTATLEEVKDAFEDNVTMTLYDKEPFTPMAARVAPASAGHTPAARGRRSSGRV